MLYFLIKPILIHSMLAAGIVQDTFAGVAVKGERGNRRLLEATSTGTFTAPARKSSVS